MNVKAPRVAFVCALLAPAAAYGAAPLSAAELREYCLAYDAEPAGRGGRLCVKYVQGFVDGLIASDARVAPTNRDSESWAERAARTRLGPRYQPNLLSTECLDDPVAMRELIARVLERLRLSSDDDSNAREVVLAVLRERSPCSE